MTDEQCAVLDFWFLPFGASGHGEPRAEWFRKDPAFDDAIRARFGGLVERALGGDLKAWSHGEAALAQILLLDQFPRNLYRNQARAFAGDVLALAAAESLLQAREDLALPPVMRVFAYLPFEHAESLADQAQSVACFEALAHEWPHGEGFLDYAQRHQAVIERFGRFPHRNAILGRLSTTEELQFLSEPGSRF